MESLLSKPHKGVLDSNQKAVYRHQLDTIVLFAGGSWENHPPDAYLRCIGWAKQSHRQTRPHFVLPQRFGSFSY